jgi:hypothetical protein
MIALLALAALALQDPPAAALGDLPPQPALAGQCALFIWVRAEPPQRVAMAREQPASLRIIIDGTQRDLPLLGRQGEPVAGFAPKSHYGDATITVRLDLAIVVRDGLSQGAVFNQGVLRLERQGGESAVYPVGGLIGCN